MIIRSKPGPTAPSVSREHLTRCFTAVINNTAKMGVIPRDDEVYLDNFIFFSPFFRKDIKQSSWANLFHPLGKLYIYF